MLFNLGSGTDLIYSDTHNLSILYCSYSKNSCVLSRKNPDFYIKLLALESKMIEFRLRKYFLRVWDIGPTPRKLKLVSVFSELK